MSSGYYSNNEATRVSPLSFPANHPELRATSSTPEVALQVDHHRGQVGPLIVTLKAKLLMNDLPNADLQ
jgi:hypothetical protein